MTTKSFIEQQLDVLQGLADDLHLAMEVHKKRFAEIVEERDALRAALKEVEEYLDDRADVNDGVDGRPVPNTAMTLLQTVRAALKLGEQ